ncbi:MAG TPA: NUDIX hydrolase [Aggregatilineales bacterium]|nr:NUDIX hydrolase [Aggregatilineales bacterium]
MISKRRFAAFLRRFPRLGKLIIRTYRLSVPRFSAGVVGVLLDEQGRVFMVEHVFHTDFPWGLPGGWVGRMEEPADALCREFREETGLNVQVVRPLMIHKGQFWGSHLDIAFLLRNNGGLTDITLSPELTNYGWFPPDALPSGISPFSKQVINFVTERSSIES